MRVVHNGVLEEREDPAAGRALYIKHPVRYGETPAEFRAHPPRLGEHSDEVLREVGYDADAITRLRSLGAVH